MLFNRDDFQHNKFYIKCRSKEEAQRCVSFLHSQGFTWHKLTGFDETVTQWNHTVGNEIIYITDSEYPDTMFFTELHRLVDMHKNNSSDIPFRVYEFDRDFGKQIECSPEEVLDLLRG